MLTYIAVILTLVVIGSILKSRTDAEIAKREDDLRDKRFEREQIKYDDMMKRQWDILAEARRTNELLEVIARQEQ